LNEPRINDDLSAPRGMRQEPSAPAPAPANVPNSQLTHGVGGAIPLGGEASMSPPEPEYVAPPRPKDLWKPGDKVVLVKGPAPGDVITS
jgi:hypothetical protein